VAIAMVCFAAFFAGGSVLIDVPGVLAKDAGSGLAAAGLIGGTAAALGMATTRRFGQPRFLIPPPMRPGYEQTVPPGLAGPTIAGIQEAREARSYEAARTAAWAFDLATEAAGSEAGSEFIVMAGYGSHLVGAASDTGRLVLTTSRLFLSTRRPNPSGCNRSWPVAELREISAGPGDTGLTLRFADGHEEVFTVAKQRGLWLGRVSKLLSLPPPVTSWYGDPAGADRLVTGPAETAMVVLWRADGEQRDRLIGYRVLLDGRKAAKIKRGKRIEFPVSPGRHVICLRSIWVGSPFIPFEAEAGQVLRFSCEPGGFPGMTQADLERDVTGYIRLRRL
jgi:hypothetical protein